MNTPMALWQQILLYAIVLAVLFLPFLYKKAEEELELFLFICGLGAVTAARLWSGHLIWEAVKEPIMISGAVLLLGWVFKRYGGGLHRFTHALENKTGPKCFLFLLVFLLGLFSSLLTAVIAALIAAEIIKALHLEDKSKIRLAVYTCFAIGMGAVLTPIGEPLSTIVVARLREAPYHAGFFFLLHQLGIWIIPGLTAFALLAMPLGNRPLTDGKYAVSTETNATILTRAGKVYIFVAALILLGEGLKPLAEQTILSLSRGILYWLNTVSAVLDNATLASIEIQPSLAPDSLVFLLMSLVLAGGLLIQGNIPNIICASKLDIKSRQWALTALPVGLLFLTVYFAVLCLIF